MSRLFRILLVTLPPDHVVESTHGTCAAPSLDLEKDRNFRWGWQQCLPQCGTEVYITALKVLGMDLARAVPKKVEREAITPLDQPVTGDLLAGHFGRSTTKERVLKLTCI